MTEKRGTARTWRLYAVAIVAAVYVLAWSQIAPAPTVASSSVWLDELPPTRRPALTPPTGWRLADRSDVIAPIPRRVPSSEPPRIRTRSS